MNLENSVQLHAAERNSMQSNADECSDVLKTKNQSDISAHCENIAYAYVFESARSTMNLENSSGSVSE